MINYRIKEPIVATLVIFALVGVIFFSPVVSGTTIKKKYTWIQNSREEFEKGELKNVQIMGEGESAYLTLPEDSNSNFSFNDSILTPPKDLEQAKKKFNVIGLENPSKPANPLQGGTSSNKVLTKFLGARKTPSRIGFFLRLAKDQKKTEIIFEGGEGDPGIVLTTSLSRDGLTSSGMLIADEGDGRTLLADVGCSEWLKVVLENIDYQQGEYDLVIQSSSKSTFSDISFFKNVDEIARVSFETAPDVSGYWIPLKMDGLSWFETDTYLKRGYFVSSVLDSYSKENDDRKIRYVTYDQLSVEGGNLGGVKLQLAHSEDNSSWSKFLGPDGTTSSFYRFSDSSENLQINGHENYRFLRYKVYLVSNSPSVLPELGEVRISFTITRMDLSSGERDYVTYRS